MLCIDGEKKKCVNVKDGNGKETILHKEKVGLQEKSTKLVAKVWEHARQQCHPRGSI